MRSQRADWILASASPRRIEMLREAGQSFAIEASGIAEEARPGEAPAEFAARTALDKAAAIAARRPDRWVLAADTIVIVGERALGKPRDEEEARAMLRELSDRAHEVVTAFVLLQPKGATFRAGLVRTRVVFRPLDASEIDAYVASGESLDKAGAYAVQGGAARFVAALEGSHTNVIGLPFDEVRAALDAAGLWRHSPP